MEPPQTRPSTGPAPDALWLFDGVCNFCSGSVQMILAIDRKEVMRFTPIQSAYGRQIAIDAGVDPDTPSTFLFFDRDAALEKSTAIIALLRRLEAPWRWFAVLIAIWPQAWRDAAYDRIAANRYRLMGRKTVCMVPTPAVRARFIMDGPV
ncbi:thiol-disulfide oxidoreductase DCC family protein [soil metagenome]